jgi:hypothetical protein
MHNQMGLYLFFCVNENPSMVTAQEMVLAMGI